MAHALGARSVASMSSEDSTLVVHVRCGPHGEWFIQEGPTGDPLSWHGNETEAEQAAIAHARRAGGGHVFVRDRYHRVHPSDRRLYAR
jgi:hypothetical protein